jgi:soluble lytic murein transglycosylase
MSIVPLPRHVNSMHSPTEAPGGARREQLEVVSEQFEALFLQQILKQMRKASDVLTADNPMRSRDLDTMRDFYDELLADTLAQKKQVGIADMLVRQLSGGAEQVAEARDPMTTLPSLTGAWQRGADGLSSAWQRGTAAFKALVDSVIKHESAGDSTAVSATGARGLMQLMPATAEEMAAELGLVYSEQRLTEDAEYNKRLGSAYLSKMLDRYDGQYALALAAYNAGPGKVDEWLQRNGDPRKGDIEVAAWVQQIPYKETRDYTRNILNDLQAAAVPAVPAVQPGGEHAARAPVLHPRWSAQAQLEPAAMPLRHAEQPQVNSFADSVALQDRKQNAADAHRSVAFAQPIRIESKEGAS